MANAALLLLADQIESGDATVRRQLATKLRALAAPQAPASTLAIQEHRACPVTQKGCGDSACRERCQRIRLGPSLADAWYAGRRSAHEIPADTATGPQLQVACADYLLSVAAPQAPALDHETRKLADELDNAVYWAVPPDQPIARKAVREAAAALRAAPRAPHVEVTDGGDWGHPDHEEADRLVVQLRAAAIQHSCAEAHDLFAKAADALVAAPRAHAAAFDMTAHLQRQREFSERTFGPGTRTAGVIDHIRKELREIEADPTDISEWIDVVILALDGAWRAGYTPEAIVSALVAKQDKNEARDWPDWRTAPHDTAIEHVRAPAAPRCPFCRTSLQYNGWSGVAERSTWECATCPIKTTLYPFTPPASTTGAPR